MKPFVIFIFTLLLFSNVQGQEVRRYKANDVRILFLLDVSGSMNETWNGRKKIDVAKEVLRDLADSIQKKYPKVTFGLRVFGADFPREQKNCKDSRLLIPFSNKQSDFTQNNFSSLTPKGMTPIAYSLEQAAKDFPNDSNAVHSIVLITDGDENCSGDPCKSANFLVRKKISFRPFIVGLGVAEKVAKQFDCIGQFTNTTDDASLKQTVGVIIRQTMNSTSAQVNLLDAQSNPTVTNLPFTLYDSETGKVEYNFIHTLNAAGMPDTLFLNPLGMYNLVVHTFPPVRKNNIELAVGIHNIISVDVPVGTQTTVCNGSAITNNDAQVVVRLKDNSILNVQDLNEKEDYLANTYTSQVLTNPYYQKDVAIAPFTETENKIPGFGTIIITSTQNKKATVLYESNRLWKKAGEWSISTKPETIKLQPGSYRIVYQPIGNTDTESCKTKFVELEEGRTLTLTLD